MRSGHYRSKIEMTIETRTETYYYCTDCDKEYDIGDKKDGLVCIECSTCIEKVEGCKDCMYQCYELDPKNIRSHLQGCGRWFCENCVESTRFDAWYPGTLCKKCVARYGLEEFYGNDHGQAKWDEIEVWRKVEYGKFPMKSIPVGTSGEVKTRKIFKNEMDQKIFQRFYVSAKNKKKKSGVV